MFAQSANPTTTSFAARVREIAEEIRRQEGPFNVTLQGKPAYFSSEADCTRWRLVEAERRARAETRYEGALRSILSDLEAHALERGRLLQARGLSNDDAPSLNVICAANRAAHLVASMTRRLAELERAASMASTHYVLTDAGRAVLAQARARDEVAS
jgi:hypothetical protein